MRNENTILLFITAMSVIFGALMYLLLYHIDGIGREKIDKLNVECEKIGGILLDRTYPVGRSQGHAYTCVREEVILKVK